MFEEGDSWGVCIKNVYLSKNKGFIYFLVMVGKNEKVEGVVIYIYCNGLEI